MQIQKIFLSIIIVTSFFIGTLSVNANESLVQKIYKLQTYKKNDIWGNYEYIQYGSAVLIGDKKIITNAHVVLDENDSPIGNYNLCISDTFELQPKCKTSIKLIKYDETNDLALLEPIEDISFGSPIKFSDKKLDLGEIVSVYGYPSNGGKTITLTEGKISGLENSIYKIDANIDAGNSGGGAFDKKGDFIGIPYSASIGYSTLGYMIPVSKIKDFLADKGDITNYNKTDVNFIVYINKINTSILEQKVTNQYFQFDNFTQKNFSLQEVNDNNPSTKQSEYYFLSKTEKTNISITVNETLGNEYYNYAQDVKSLKESYSKVAVKSNITLGGKKINKLIALFGPKKPDGVIDKNTISLVFVLNGITFSIYTNHYNSEKQAFNNAFSLFIKNFKLKNNSLINNETNYKIVAGTFQIIPEMNFNKFVGYTSFYFNSNLNNYGNVSVTKEKDDGGKYSLNNYTFDEWAKENLYLSSSNKNEIQKNSFGAYYIRAKETEKNGRINYFDTFITKINDDIYIVYINFSIQESNSKLENNYNQFINSINLNGSIPFKNAVTGELKLDDTKK